MGDFRRPADKYERADSVYPGATSGYLSCGDQIEPLYVIARMPCGVKAIAGGVWTCEGETVFTSPAEAIREFALAGVKAGHGPSAAVALVALVGHSLPGDDTGDVVTVLDVSLSNALATDGGPSYLPWMRNLKAAVVAAARRFVGATDSDYVRPEPDAAKLDDIRRQAEQDAAAQTGWAACPDGPAG